MLNCSFWRVSFVVFICFFGRERGKGGVILFGKVFRVGFVVVVSCVFF